MAVLCARKTPSWARSLAASSKFAGEAWNASDLLVPKKIEDGFPLIGKVMKGVFQIMELSIRHSALHSAPCLVGIDESILSANNDEDWHLQAAEICI